MHKIERDISKQLILLRKKYPVLSITGPRQSGKTTLCKEIFKDLDYLNLEHPETREFALEDPKGLLAKYPQGVILDEIQRAPELTSYIQVRVDEDDFKGNYVLTGSQNFQIMNTLSQSLAGRVGLATLLPFSLSEIQPEVPNYTVDDYLFHGFYPRIYEKQLSPPKAYSDYVSTYVERDIRQLEFVKDLQLFHKFLKLCAGRIGQLLNLNSLSNDVGVSHSTAREWISLLEASYILFRIPPFYENIGKRLVKSPKIYFYDTGLVSYLLGIEETKQLETHPLRGNLFENFVIVELLKNRLNNLQENNFLFYRDSNGNEVDLLIPTANLYKAIEIKSASTVHKTFFKGLKNFSKAVGKTSAEYLIYGGKEERKHLDTNIIPSLSSESLKKVIR